MFITISPHPPNYFQKVVEVPYNKRSDTEEYRPKPSCKANRNNPAEVKAKVNIYKPAGTSAVPGYGPHTQKIIWPHCSLSLSLVPKSIRAQTMGTLGEERHPVSSEQPLPRMRTNSWVKSAQHVSWESSFCIQGLTDLFKSKPHPKK